MFSVELRKKIGYKLFKAHLNDRLTTNLEQKPKTFSTLLYPVWFAQLQASKPSNYCLTDYLRIKVALNPFSRGVPKGHATKTSWNEKINPVAPAPAGLAPDTGQLPAGAAGGAHRIGIQLLREQLNDTSITHCTRRISVPVGNFWRNGSTPLPPSWIYIFQCPPSQMCLSISLLANMQRCIAMLCKILLLKSSNVHMTYKNMNNKNNK